jgi:hypothetical protein
MSALVHQNILLIQPGIEKEELVGLSYVEEQTSHDEFLAVSIADSSKFILYFLDCGTRCKF